MVRQPDRDTTSPTLGELLIQKANEGVNVSGSITAAASGTARHSTVARYSWCTECDPTGPASVVTGQHKPFGADCTTKSR